jgi:hypothetical protein
MAMVDRSHDETQIRRLEPMLKPTFTIAWSLEDDEYVATSQAHPGLSGLDPDPMKALEVLLEAIQIATG